MSDIDNNLRIEHLGRFALLMLRQSLRDMDSPEPTSKLSAANWFASQDAGLASFPSTCEYLAGYVRSLDPAIAQGYARSPKVQEVGTLRHPDHWQALVEATLVDGPDARVALCGMLRDLSDPQSMPGGASPPTVNPDRGSPRSGSPGMS